MFRKSTWTLHRPPAKDIEFRQFPKPIHVLSNRCHSSHRNFVHTSLCSSHVMHHGTPKLRGGYCHDLIILISNWCLPITHHFRKITLRNHLRTTHLPSPPNKAIHNTTQNITPSLSGDQMLLGLDSLIGFPNHSMTILGLWAITIPIFSRGIFGQKCPLPTLEFTR